MAFLDTMSSLGYELTEQREKVLTFVRKRQKTQLNIIFNLTDKWIDGIVVPATLIITQKDIDDIQKDFDILRKDVLNLSKLSNYVIINNREEHK